MSQKNKFYKTEKKEYNKDKFNYKYAKPVIENIDFDNVLEQFYKENELYKIADNSKKQIQLMLENLTIESNQKLNKFEQFIVEEAKINQEKKDRGFSKYLYNKIKQIKTPQKKENYLDDWQQKALNVLTAGNNLIVDAPTSAGKTRIIEAFIDLKINDGLKLIYTSPVKSLSNDKYKEFCEKYGTANVGINTGDFKENLSAPIILATLETYRNSLLGIEPRMDRFIVIFDEYHFLQDESRGSAWEESIILTPKESQLVMLSASVPNTAEFASWINNLTLNYKKCEIITVEKRPVPLVNNIFSVKYGFLLDKELKLSSNVFADIKKYARKESEQNRRFFKNAKNKYDFLIPLTSKALDLNLGPIVIYAGRRNDTEKIALLLSKNLTPLTAEETKKIAERLVSLSGLSYIPIELQKMIRKYGVAYHHSGLIPAGRVAIESLLKEGILRICSGTMGISLGVNFAVRSAIIADESRPGDGGENRYSSTEIMQMLGRAGRRGKDKQGFSIWSDIGRFVLQKPGEREICKSSLKIDPTTVLSLLGQKIDLHYLSEFYKKSFFMWCINNKEKNGDKLQKIEEQVMLPTHELISAKLYKDFSIDNVPCTNILDTINEYLNNKKKKHTQCNTCIIKKECHSLVNVASKSSLNIVIEHLGNIGALVDFLPTKFGNIARHFPQSGGLLIANWLATGQMNERNFEQYMQALACFCGAYHKDIPNTFADHDFLQNLGFDALISTYYPYKLFPELYDDYRNKISYREFNLGVASVVKMWSDENTTWEELIFEHESKNFSPGDCVMVLFRLATFLQSCIRLDDIEPEISRLANNWRRIILRSPLDARNKLLEDEVDEIVN